MPLKRLKRVIKRTLSGSGLQKGFSDKDLVNAVTKQISVEESNARRRKASASRVLGKKIRVNAGLSAGLPSALVMVRDVIVGTKLEKIVLERPMAAKALASHFKGTRHEKYFKRLSDKAIGRKIIRHQNEVKKN